MEVLKEKGVQYFPFVGKDKVLQVNLSDRDTHKNRENEEQSYTENQRNHYFMRDR